MMTISVIVGSTRQGRFSEKPAQWDSSATAQARRIEGRLLDLRDFPMPFFDQPTPPAMPGRPPYEHEVVKEVDGSNRGLGWFCIRHAGIQLRPVLKNAIDWVYPEWNRKAAAFVSYGKRHGCASRPAASRDGNRDSNGTDSVICSHSRLRRFGHISRVGT